MLRVRSPSLAHKIKNKFFWFLILSGKEDRTRQERGKFFANFRWRKMKPSVRQTFGECLSLPRDNEVRAPACRQAGKRGRGGRPVSRSKSHNAKRKAHIKIFALRVVRYAPCEIGHVAKLVDAHASGACGAILESSNLSMPTAVNYELRIKNLVDVTMFMR